MLRKIFFCSLFSICSLLSGKEVIDFGDSGHPLKFYASGKHFPVIASDGTPMRLFQAGKKYYEIRLREKKLYWKAPVFELDLKLDLPEKDSVKIVALHLEDADGELVIFNKELKKDYKVLYKEALYKVRQDISVVLENQPPSIDTAALYEEINESHAGTHEDPIPYNNNMKLEQGKYYSQNDVVYYCHTSTGIPVYANLSELTTFVNPVE